MLISSAPFGQLQVSDSLINLLQNQTTVLDYGPDMAFTQIQEDADAWNKVVNAELSVYADMTTDSERLYGGAQRMKAQRGTQRSMPWGQKVEAPALIGFKLERAEIALDWTYDYMATHSVSQLEAQWTATKQAHLDWIYNQLQNALLTPLNRPIRLTDGTLNPNAYYDKLINNIPRPLFGLLNADGFPVPIGPNGEIFNSATHTHYMASDWTAGGSTPTTRAADAQALIQNVIEHRVTGQAYIFINSVDEPTWQAMTGFILPQYPGVRTGQNITFADGDIDIYNIHNHFTGVFRGFQVWVKPWVPASYATAFATGTGMGADSDRILVWRTRPNGTFADWTVRFKNPSVKSEVDTIYADGGASVWNRHMGAILYTGGGTYVVPTVNWE